MDKSTKNTRIAVIILNWKDIEKTVECVESVARSRKVIPEVFLLDNETDETAFKELKKRLSEYDLKINFFASYQNLGFAGGINYEVNQINLDNFAAIFLLNNDARVTEDTLCTLAKESREKDMPMLGPKTQSSKTGPSRRWPWWLFGLRLPHEYDERKNIRPTFHVGGSGLYIDKFLVNKILDRRGHLFKKNYFLYCEDTELGLFAKKIGFQSYISFKTNLKHERRTHSSEERRMLTYYYITRNRLLLARDYLSIYLKPVFHIYYLLSRFLIAAFRLTKGQNKLAFGIWEGLKDGYSNNYGKWEEHPSRDL